MHKINNERKGVVASIVKEVKQKLKKREIGKVIVTGDPSWKPSLLGLVANTLAEEFHCPVFLWGREGGGDLKGSCRSDGSVHLLELMEKIKNTFSHFGGHAFAAGFVIQSENIHTLEEQLCQALLLLQTEKRREPKWIDGELTLDNLAETHLSIKKLAPFGVGNPKPLFIFKEIIPTKVRHFGKGEKHLELQFGSVRAIGFFMQKEQFKNIPEIGKPMSVLANLEESYFRGRREERLRIVDIV